jgi:putative phage-type endonuclease
MAIRPIPADRDEWLALRRNFVGASEVAAILGVQADFQIAPYALFLIKRGEMPEPDLSGEEIIQAGVYLEPGIANWACAKNGWVQKPGVFATDDHCSGMSATLDRVILPSKEDVEKGFVGPGALECKNVSGWQFKSKWGDDEPPAHIMVQLQAQLACTGHGWGAIAGLDGGNRLVCKRYLARPRMHAAIRAAITDFWNRVRENRQYEPDGFDSTTAALRHLYPDASDEAVLEFPPDSDLAAVCAQLKTFERDRLALEKEEQALKNKVKSMLGNHARARIEGMFSVSRSVGKDTPDRPAMPGEIIRGRRGQDRLTIREFVAETAKTSKRKKAA